MSIAKILIVEDDAILAAHLEMILSQMGYQVVGLAATGESAVQTALEQEPDVILMDVHLRGEMNGIQAAAQIHQHNQVPIIYLTAYTDEDSLQQAKTADAYAYLSKPVRDRELRASIEMALYKRKIERRLTHLNQVLHAIRNINKLIVREQDPQRLLDEACDILMRTRGYQFVWIGRLEDHLPKSLASAGTGKDLLDQMHAASSADQIHDLPYITAMRENKIVICRDMLQDGCYAPWQDAIEKAHFSSLAAIPIVHAGEQVAALCVFTNFVDGFDDEEIDLLLEVANDLAFGLQILEQRSARLSAEEALLASERRLKLFVEYAPAAIAMFDREMHYLAASQRFLIDYRLGDQPIIGHSHYEIFPDIPERWKEIHRRCQAGEVLRCDEDPFPRLDGTIDWVRWEIHPWYEKTGEIGGILLFSEVLTANKQVEVALLESEARYRQIVENATLALVVHVDNKIVYANPAALKMIGADRSEVFMGRNVLEFVHPDDRSRILELIGNAFAPSQNLLAGNLPLVDEERLIRLDKTIITIEASAILINYYGQTGMLVMMNDITDRKRAELDLQELNRTLEMRVQERSAELSDLYNNAPCGYHSLDLNGIFIRVNDTELKWLGYSREELIGKLHVTDLLTPDSIPIFLETFPVLKERGWANNIELQFFRKDGSILPVLISATVVRDAEGHYLMSRSTMIDNTSRKRAEKINQEMTENLARRSSDLEISNKELEAFAYSVSHDLRAPLRAIDGFSRIVSDDYSEILDDEAKRLLNIIRNNAQKMDRLISDLLSLSRVSRAELNRTRIDMTELVDSIFKELATAEIREKFTFSLAPLPDAYGDTILMHQVWSNLLANAIKYTLPKENRSIEIGSYQENDRTVYFIKDTGVGFEAEYTDKLFGVFQRLHTSDEFEGTGVGLAIVQRIIHRHGGTVWAEGKVNQGATFYFSLPEKSSEDEG
jgi:PAS domain S-box-containing protein